MGLLFAMKGRTGDKGDKGDKGDQGTAGGAFTSRCSAYRSTNQAIVKLTDTKIEFDTKLWDSDNEFDSTNGYDFTALVTGWYHITTQVYLEGVATYRAIIEMVVEGVCMGQSEVNNQQYYFPRISKDVYLIAGEAVHIEVYHTHSANRNVIGGRIYSYLDIHRIG